jgi:hypothetical protein
VGFTLLLFVLLNDWRFSFSKKKEKLRNAAAGIRAFWKKATIAKMPFGQYGL